MMKIGPWVAPLLFVAIPTYAQDTAKAADAKTAPKQFVVEAGTRIPLQLINSISTKTAATGDRVYLQTAFPILVGGRVVIPPGSYVSGTVTSLKRAGKIKGRSELYVRFDSLTLPNGVTRDFRSRIGALDGTSPGELDRTEGKVKGDTDKGNDAMKVGEAGAYGAMIGGISRGSGKGAGIGAAAGAAAGLVGVMLTRGPDATLERGTTLEMVLDRPITYEENELAFGPSQAQPMALGPGESQRRSQSGSGSGWPSRRVPIRPW
jgi:hypothetical protein